MRSQDHQGKAQGLNQAAAEAGGDLLVFTDADAELPPNALRMLASHFQDPEVGGVCGRRVIAGTRGEAREAQSSYIAFDSGIKLLENRLGAITSNDGKLYAIRRELFEPRARALIPTPSRTARKELRRRRRIVCRSLAGMRDHAGLVSSPQFGRYGLRLLVNKGLRRALPLSLVLLLVGTAMLLRAHPVFALLFAGQVVFYLAATAYLLLPSPWQSRIRPLQIVFYFCVGNIGTLLGLWDYVCGRRYVKWEPGKKASDEAAGGGAQ
jgi:glycosyltransferase involved in cell wall biosynthesis